MNQPSQQAADQQAGIEELRAVVVHQAALLLQSARQNVTLQGQVNEAMQANSALVGEVQRLRAIFTQQEKERADVGSVANAKVIDAEGPHSA